MAGKNEHEQDYVYYWFWMSLETIFPSSAQPFWGWTSSDHKVEPMLHYWGSININQAKPAEELTSPTNHKLNASQDGDFGHECLSEPPQTILENIYHLNHHRKWLAWTSRGRSDRACVHILRREVVQLCLHLGLSSDRGAWSPRL